MQALHKIKVLDLSGLAPGPFCTMLLADFGADVVVLEAPPGVGRRQQFPSEEALAYNPVFRNKRSIAVNLKDERGLEVFFRLAKETDVIVEGFRPGVARRLGIDYEAVRKRNNRTVYCSLSGYGQDGPYAELPGHDLNYISLGGALGMFSTPDDGPAIPMNFLADYAAGGLYAAFAIMIALYAREETGRGQYIDMAMSDGVASLVSAMAARYLHSGWIPRPSGETLNGGVPYYNVYKTADEKQLSVGCIEPWFWERLCQTLGCPQYAAEQFNQERHAEIFSYLRKVFLTKTRDTWFEELRLADTCVAPVYTVDEMFEDPHAQARQILTEVVDPKYGPIKQVGVAPKLSETPGVVRKTSPRRGEDTFVLLRATGYTEEDLQELARAGVVAQADSAIAESASS